MREGFGSATHSAAKAHLMGDALLVVLGAAVSLIASLITQELQHRRQAAKDHLESEANSRRLDVDRLVDYLGASATYVQAIDERRRARRLEGVTATTDRPTERERTEFVRAQFAVLVRVEHGPLVSLILKHTEAVVTLSRGVESDVNGAHYAQLQAEVSSLTTQLLVGARFREGIAAAGVAADAGD